MERKKILAKFNLAVMPRSILCHHEHCTRVYLDGIGVLPSSCLKYLNKAVSWKKYKKCNWYIIGSVLAPSQLYIQLAQRSAYMAGPRVLLHALHHYALQAKIILVNFNLAVSTPTAKPPNLIPHQLFRLYGSQVHSSQFGAQTLF